MSVIVQDSGFVAEDFTGEWLDLPSDTDPSTLAQFSGVASIRIDFPAFSDGRGFTLAKLLRLAGFKGRLRANGHVIADQYAMARRSGFDEVSISDDLAARQPADQWLARADWQAHDYQARLRAAAKTSE
ncbi:DUF934 domain-containing protein [Pacificibacter sp. AS14]|uniref:DUF934 domain-containing protein n=1 Tax=Pacificibacter sp. AS14 TaxID=3135785 RepID=UPI00316B29DB